MRTLAKRGLLALLLILALVASAHAQESQRNCWPATVFKSGDSVAVIRVKDKAKLSVLLPAGTELAPALNALNIKTPTVAKTQTTADFYFRKGTSRYEVGEVPITLPAGMRVAIDKTAVGADNRISGDTVAAIDPAAEDMFSIAQNTTLTSSTFSATDDFRLDLLPSASPRGGIKAKAFKLGTDFAATKNSMAACLLTASGWQPVPIEAITTGEDKAELTIHLPDNIGWGFAWPSMATIAVTLPDGKYAAIGKFMIVPVWIGAVAAFFVLLLGHVFIWRLAIKAETYSDFKDFWQKGSLGKFAQAWFSAANQVPSLAMFQIYLWTWVIIIGLTYVVTLTGQLFTITAQVLALLGIAGLGSLAARFVAPPPSTVDNTRTPAFSDILKTDEKLDLFKLQMFLFTVYAAGFVVVRIAMDQAFPSLEANLLLLMGVSNGIYVGSKVAPSESPYAAAARLDIELQTLNAAKANADAEVTSLNDQKNTLAQQRATLVAAGSPTTAIDAQINANQDALPAAIDFAADLQKKIDAATAAKKAAIAKIGT